MSAAELTALARKAQARELEQTVADVCALVGLARRELQARNRTEEIARQRAVVAWILRERLRWPVADVAQALQRTPRQVRKLVRAQKDR